MKYKIKEWNKKTEKSLCNQKPRLSRKDKRPTLVAN